MKLSRHFRSVIAGLAVCLGLVALSTNALAATPMVATGGYHTVVLKSDGTVVTWGYNGDGELGNGSTTDRSSPAKAPVLSGVVAVATGSYYTVALKSDGTVATWGYNGHGQLGDGTTTQRTTSVAVAGLAGVAAVAAGNGLTVALKSDGTVVAWGYNVAGQLGDGTTTDRYSPVAVRGLTSVGEVAAGLYHTTALKSDGTVVAWGRNSDGQLGDGTTTDRYSPVSVPGLTGVIAVAAGGFHTVALKSDGTVVAWGDNSVGQLADGTMTHRLNSGAVVGLAGVVAVAAGGGHNVALKSDGTVVAWGQNTSGQLGDGTTTQRLSPVAVPGLSGVVAVAAGYRNTVALKSDGTVVAWGQNNYGQLGDGSTTDRLSPVAVTGGLNLGASAIAAYGPAVEPISNARLFAFAEDNASGIFPGAATAGQYLQYDYRYYPASGNYLVVDTGGMIYILGRYTNNALLAVGPVESFRSPLSAWEAKHSAVPAVSISPASLTFALQSNGSAAQTVTLRNTGKAALSIGSIVATGDYVRTTTCVSTLAAGDSCTISVTFTPAVTGIRVGTLTITSDASNSPNLVVPMTGTSKSPKLSLMPDYYGNPSSSYIFPQRALGTTSDSWYLSVDNTGDGDLIFSSISITDANNGHVFAFGQIHPSLAACSPGLILAAYSRVTHCSIPIVFTPSLLGKAAGTVTITSNAPGSPHTFSLSGTGVLPPSASFSPTSINFADQSLDTTSAVQIVTFTNLSNAALAISNLATSADYAQTSTCPNSLAAGASCTINVTFKPLALGTRTGALQITSNTTGSVYTADLSGTGIPAAATGQVAIWTRDTNINSVYVDDALVGSDISYGAQVKCGGLGTITLTLPVGVHSIMAYASQFTYTQANFTITPGGCLLFYLAGKSKPIVTPLPTPTPTPSPSPSPSPSPTPTPSPGSGDLNNCAEIVETRRGANCGTPDSVTIQVRNMCSSPMDMGFCLQRTTGQWACGRYGRADPGASTSYYICNGTGSVWSQGKDPASRAAFDSPYN